MSLKYLKIRPYIDGGSSTKGLQFLVNMLLFYFKFKAKIRKTILNEIRYNIIKKTNHIFIYYYLIVFPIINIFLYT